MFQSLRSIGIYNGQEAADGEFPVKIPKFHLI